MVLVRPTPSVIELAFQSIALKVVTQEIPIKNHSEDLWTIKSHIKGSDVFTCGFKTVFVKPGSVFNLPISYRPMVPGDYEGTLNIFNAFTNQTSSFKLKGTTYDEALKHRKALVSVLTNLKPTLKSRETHKQHGLLLSEIKALPQLLSKGLITESPMNASDL